MIWQQLSRRNINGQSSSMRERETSVIWLIQRRYSVFHSQTSLNIFCHHWQYFLSPPQTWPQSAAARAPVRSEPLAYSKRHRNFNYYGYSFLFFFCLFPCRSHLKSVLRPATVAAVTNQGHIGEDTFTVLHSDLQPCLSCRFVSAICITKRCPSCFT